MLGCIEVIAGGMYSGKTEELIRRLRRATWAKQKVLLFKPIIDTRYSEKDVVSHVGAAFSAIPVTDAGCILSRAKSTDISVVGIDEAQFLEGLPEVCLALANAGKRVILAGLDMDWRGKPFGPMPELLALAEKVTKLQAICMVCGGEAGFTFKGGGSMDQVEVGGTETYEARCRSCMKLPLETRECG